MRKLITMLLAVMIASVFAADWFSASERITNPVEPNTDKAYEWYTYSGGAVYVYSTYNERATLVNAEDFGLSYPVNFGGVQSYLYDVGYTSSYRIYDRDGATVLWQSDDFTTTKAGYEVVQPAAPVILNDDFYIVHIPFLEVDGKGYPRIILDGGDGTQGHCFRGFPGAWTTRDPYAWKMYVALEQYTGADISGPSARCIYGGDAFMDYDANIVLAVTDESGISTLTGAYTVDGITWINVEMNPAKANYYEYVGVVPAQVDGTVGEAVFFISDNLGNSSESIPFPLSWSMDNSILTEGFEGNFPPVGWSTSNVGAGFIKIADDDPIVLQVYSGNSAAAHMDDSGAQDDWLISPLISVPADNSTTLTFWQSGWWVSYYTFHEVSVSTDMVSWTQIYEGFPPLGAGQGNEWEKIYLSLQSYIGQDIYIGFHYEGDWSDQWFIDDFAVMYDYEGPTVVDLVGNEALYPTVGAYLNNDMVLNVTANDLSGVQSVVGHYTFDGGTTIIDLPFVKAKGGDEVWTATIPADSVAIAGTINFDMVDIGGIVSPTTADYDIEFVLDTDVPIFNYVKGTEAFVDDPMNLEISFSDESAITSCSGFYSKDGGVSWTPFVMEPSKIHDYVYSGTIGAETSEVLDGLVHFGVRDVEDNVLMTGDYTVKWMDGQIEFFEDFEAGAGNWTFTGNWAIVAEGEYTSAVNALTESPGGDYEADEVTTAQWTTPIDLTPYPSAAVSFWTKFDLEDGFDYMYFEGSKDGGTTWIRLETYNGEGIGWHEEKVAMGAFAGQSNVSFRFLFESDGGYETEGMYIDDLKLTTYNIDHEPPSIISDPYRPLFYEGVVEVYTDKVEISDFSGIASAIVYYNVDGGVEQNVTAVNTSDDWYEFTIPKQDPGSQVDYRIYAQDASPQLNEGYSKYYSYIAGDHMIYDSGYVDYYMEVAETEAKAVRVTVPGSDESKTIMTGKLSYILFRNYADASHISTDMEVHVWEDNAGVPGDDILITPFDVTSEASPTNTSAMTRVDMRSYDLNVSGDFWVGVVAAHGSVYMTMERATMSADSAYGRSSDGTWNAVTGSYDWAVIPNDNWHFRAVLNGIYVGIEDDSNLPMVTELKQNYPNPFNPATTINFNLSKDSKVSLVVYDVMGREVANLVNKDMVRGSHKVSFDASRLVSGVYYYNLKAGNVNQTKKMMLIK